MFSFANVFHLFTNKFAGLGRRRFAFPFVLSRSFDCFLFRHNKKVSWRIGFVENGGRGRKTDFQPLASSSRPRIVVA